MSRAMALGEKDIETPEKRGKYAISVIGCGRTGLKTACLFAESGFKVVGVDVNHYAVDLLRKGKASFVEPKLNTLIKKHLKKGSITITKKARKAASTSDIIIFILPTPVRKKKTNYFRVEKTCREVGMGLRSGTLIIFESTMAPGASETLVKETLENTSGLKAGIDFGLAYSPIRVYQGRVMQDMFNYPMIVGAINKQSLKAASLILGSQKEGGLIE